MSKRLIEGYVPGVDKYGRIDTDKGWLTREEFERYVDDDYLTEEEARQLLDEIRKQFEELKKHGIKDIRFTCKGA